MKRKITNLEKKLLDNGWRLHRKYYCGKNSDRVDSYEYCNILEYGYEKLECVLWLDRERSCVKRYVLVNDTTIKYVDELYLKDLSRFYDFLTAHLLSIGVLKEDDTNEVVETITIIEENE